MSDPKTEMPEAEYITIRLPKADDTWLETVVPPYAQGNKKTELRISLAIEKLRQAVRDGVVSFETPAPHPEGAGA